MRSMMLVLAAAAATTLAPAAAAQMNPADSAAIMAQQDRIAEAWNLNDLAGHVAAYADSAAFMAPGPMIGRERIRSSLERSFWREGVPVQQLRFEQVSLKPLGPDHALMTGRFILHGGGREDRSGWFTLVWQRQPQGWRIVHDHSS